MTPQLQLSTAQLAHAEQVYKRKVDAKTLECASLDRLRRTMPSVTGLILKHLEPERKPDWETEGIADTVENYLTAKLNQAIIELEELKLQLTGIQAMSNRIQPAVIVGSHSQNSK
jgi:hypothetical protein